MRTLKDLEAKYKVDKDLEKLMSPKLKITIDGKEVIIPCVYSEDLRSAAQEWIKELERVNKMESEKLFLLHHPPFMEYLNICPLTKNILQTLYPSTEPANSQPKDTVKS